MIKTGRAKHIIEQPDNAGVSLPGIIANIGEAEKSSLMPLPTALLDRLTHRCHILETGDDSIDHIMTQKA